MMGRPYKKQKKLTNEQKEFISTNIKLLNFGIRRALNYYGPHLYEDIYDGAIDGMIRASVGNDPSKNLSPAGLILIAIKRGVINRLKSTGKRSLVTQLSYDDALLIEERERPNNYDRLDVINFIKDQFPSNKDKQLIDTMYIEDSVSYIVRRKLNVSYKSYNRRIRNLRIQLAPVIITLMADITN